MGVSCDPQIENRLPGLTHRARLNTETNQLVPASDLSAEQRHMSNSSNSFAFRMEWFVRNKYFVRWVRC
jgi:hypothetical protein